MRDAMGGKNMHLSILPTPIIAIPSNREGKVKYSPARVLSIVEGAITALLYT
jgi:hypothetical protein